MRTPSIGERGGERIHGLPGFRALAGSGPSLAGYVILPAAGALVGAATHPLQAALHHLFHTEEERQQQTESGGLE